MDSEIVDYLKQLCAAHGLKLKPRNSKTSGRSDTYSLSSGRGVGEIKEGRNPITTALKNLGLYRAYKHVPMVYKTNSRDVRLEILAGILDTDGTRDGGTGFGYCSKSKILAEDVAYLARSLGFASYLKPKTKSCTYINKDGKKVRFEGIYWYVSISGDCSIIPTLLPRKQAFVRRQKKNVLNTGITVEPIGDGEYFGFELDGDGLFMLGDFTVTHNTRLIRYMIQHAGNIWQRQPKVVYTSDMRVLEDEWMFIEFRCEDYDFMVLEDIDDGLVSRKSGNKIVHKFLASSDGFVAARHKKIILSTNLFVSDIDEALIRPGRCFACVETTVLTPDQAASLSLKLGQKEHFDKSMTVADVYNTIFKTSSGVRMLNNKFGFGRGKT